LWWFVIIICLLQLLILDFRTVPTVWYFLFNIFYGQSFHLTCFGDLNSGLIPISSNKLSFLCCYLFAMLLYACPVPKALVPVYPHHSFFIEVPVRCQERFFYWILELFRQCAIFVLFTILLVNRDYLDKINSIKSHKKCCCFMI
jgi:hypothetical protein